jgi:nitrate/TMAO reductase-like tetraheme cytochrome c subunit
MAEWLKHNRLVLLIRSNLISRAGAILTTFSFLTMVSFFLLEVFGLLTGAYIGLVTFMILPGFFIAGLVMIPVGLFVYRKHLTKRIELVREKPLSLLRSVGFLTTVNIIVVSVAAYQGLHYMDSNEFCGTVCHTVMSPQYESYLTSPHARVHCTECHIGAGASWFVKSKLSGARQVFAVMFDSYQRPIPSPVHNLRPAQETCEQCHWPDKFEGHKFVIREHFRPDRESTPYTNVLVMKTGGTRPDGTSSGIHWHIHSEVEVSYVATDEQRMEIPWVKLVDHATGTEEIYTTAEVSPDTPPIGTQRTMDCVDCHNKPSHGFPKAWEAINEAISHGRISRELPFIKQVGIEALRTDWSGQGPQAGIRAELTRFYTEDEPLDERTKPLLEPAIAALTDIHQRNIYPEMEITWGTYRNMDGHLGCFRCHDGEHKTAAGKEIPLTCETCHVIEAFQERDPAILSRLRGEPLED